MSRRLLSFLGNILVNVVSGDLELLGLHVGVCCFLGVDYTPAVLTRVVCVGICVTVLGVKVIVHQFVHGV